MPQEIPFRKMQGVGNDFVVIDGRQHKALNGPVLAIAVCDRRFGVGADGLLVLDDSAAADFAMRMYNPDGSPDVCGNGLRCITRYALERGIIARDTMQIETLLDVREATANRDARGEIESVTVDMREPQFEAQQIPALANSPTSRIMDYPLPLSDGEMLTITALSTGSTHSVTFVSQLPDEAAFLRVSPQAEHHALFPERTSLMWCQVQEKNRLQIRIWERGAGETLGCGTGACAAAVAAILHGCADANCEVVVASRGGELRIEWQPGQDIRMTGPAVSVFEGVYPLSDFSAL